MAAFFRKGHCEAVAPFLPASPGHLEKSTLHLAATSGHLAILAQTGQLAILARYLHLLAVAPGWINIKVIVFFLSFFFCLWFYGRYGIYLSSQTGAFSSLGQSGTLVERGRALFGAGHVESHRAALLLQIRVEKEKEEKKQNQTAGEPS